jgi:hypothetical protein
MKGARGFDPLEEGAIFVKHPVPLTNGRRRGKLWLLVAVTLVIMGGSGALLSRRWFEREKMSFRWVRWDWDWDSSRPIRDNLADCFPCDWGGYFSITEHPSGKGAYVGITYQRWSVGPFMLQRVDYQRPGTSHD